VIPTEIDFDEFDERVARRLYVGSTRATMRYPWWSPSRR
jgi:hypothetical protein